MMESTAIDSERKNWPGKSISGQLAFLRKETEISLNKLICIGLRGPRGL